MAGRLQRSDSRESVLSASSCVSGVGGWQVGDRARIDNRPGTIAFIGSTKFAPGEWIGMILDEPQGKNDGSVQGVKYFSCPQNHGLMCKAGKLERIVMTPSRLRSPTPLGGSSHAAEVGFDIGDRVIAGSGKHGIVRFLGETDFGVGLWCGIELDQPVGKNDGSVQGKRYFVCRPLHGLFILANKVAKAPSSSSAVPKMPVIQNKSSLLRQSKHGSRESLVSVGQSSVFSSRIGTVRKPAAMVRRAEGSSSGTNPLEAALAEKEKHLEQMMAERDLERQEMSQLETKLAEAEKKIVKYKSDLLTKTKEMEEMEFRLMEENMAVEMVEPVSSAPARADSVSRSDFEKLQQEYKSVKNALEVSKNEAEKSKDIATTEVEELKRQIEEANRKVSELNASKNNADQSSSELSNKISELEKIVNDHRKQMEILTSEKQSLENRVSDLSKGHGESIQNIQTEISQKDTLIATSNAKVQELTTTIAEMEKKLMDAANQSTIDLATAKSEAEHAKIQLSSKSQELQTKVDELLKKIDTFAMEKKSLETRVDDLSKEHGESMQNIQAEINKKDGMIASSELKIKELSDGLTQLEGKLAEATEVVSARTSELEFAKNEVDKAKTELSNRSQELQKTVDELKTQIDSLQSEKQSLENRVSDLSKGYGESMKSIQAEISQKDILISTSEQKIKELTVGLTQSENKLSEAIAKISEKDSELSNAKTEEEKSHNEFLAKSEEHQNVLSELNKQIEAMRSEKNTLETRVNELTTDRKQNHESFEAELLQKNDLILANESRINELTASIVKLEQRLSENVKEIGEGKDVQTRTLLELTQRSEELEKNRQEIAQLSEKLSSLAASESALKTTLESANNDLSVLTIEKSELEKTISTNQALIFQHEAEKAEQVNQLKQVTAELSECEKKLRVSQDAYTSLQSSLDSMKLGGDSMAQELTAAKEKNCAQVAQLEQLQAELETLQANLAASSSSKNEMDSKLIELAGKNTQLEDTLKKLEQSLANETAVRSKFESELKTAIESLEAQKLTSTNQFADLEDNLRGEIGDLTSKMENLKSEKDDVCQKLQALSEQRETELQQEAQKNQELKQSLSNEVASRSKLEEELKSAKETLDALKLSSVAVIAEIQQKLASEQSEKLAELERVKSEKKEICEQLKTLNEQREVESQLEVQKRNEIEQSLANEATSRSILEEDLKLAREAIEGLKISSTNEIAHIRQELEAEQSAKIAELSSHLEQLKTEKNELSQKIQVLNEQRESELQQATQEKNELKKEITLNVEDLEKAKDEQQKVLTVTKEETERAKSEITLLKEEVNRSTKLLEDQKAMYEAKISEALHNAESAKCKDLEAQLASNKSDLERLSAELSQVSVALADSQATATGSDQKIREHQKRIQELEEKQLVLVEQINEASSVASNPPSAQMESEFAELMNKTKILSEEKQTAEQERDNAKEELNKVNTEILSLRAVQAESEIATVDAKRKMEIFNDLEQDMIKKNLALTERLAALEDELDVAKSRTQNEEIFSLNQQVNFLNSIIASQKATEDKLKKEIDVLMNPPLEDYSLPAPTEKKVKKRREYCDICCEFDLHETEDCPTQATEAAEFASHSHFSTSPAGKKEKPAAREYCDTCEMFGHDTSACPKSEENGKKKRDYTF